MLQIESHKCSECGHLHPYTAPGECPLAKEQALDNQIASSGNEKVIKLMQAIKQKFLEKMKDKPTPYAEAIATEIFKYLEQID